ncbi:hypothetical protein WH47_08832 [Habropoda laboriosa]|uniref:Uncharacterized protein n=1 Tax=Habropoda laboriosa TaxID=597456 RepID=A0A0L7R6I7_9HYME|nr:hypothetical protein WH47_08832 [Habropoda laboriosa]
MMRDVIEYQSVFTSKNGEWFPLTKCNSASSRSRAPSGWHFRRETSDRGDDSRSSRRRSK